MYLLVQFYVVRARVEPAEEDKPAAAAAASFSRSALGPPKIAGGNCRERGELLCWLGALHPRCSLKLGNPLSWAPAQELLSPDSDFIAWDQALEWGKAV